jgi:hypothetical protein
MSYLRTATLTLWLVVACGDDAAETTDMNLGAAGDGETADAGQDRDTATADSSADAGESTSADPGPFAQVHAILASSCTGAICHSDTSGAGNLVVSDEAGTYRALLDEAGPCESDRVVPNDADASLLIQKLEGTQECGGPMPLIGDLLPAAEIQTIRDWIDMGAPEG